MVYATEQFRFVAQDFELNSSLELSSVKYQIQCTTGTVNAGLDKETYSSEEQTANLEKISAKIYRINFNNTNIAFDLGEPDKRRFLGCGIKLHHFIGRDTNSGKQINPDSEIFIGGGQREASGLAAELNQLFKDHELIIKLNSSDLGDLAFEVIDKKE